MTNLLSFKYSQICYRIKYGETKCVTFDPGSRTNSIYIQSQLDTVQLLRPINNNDFFYKVFVLNIEMDTEAIRYRQKACYGVTKMADDETEVAFRRL